MGFTALRAFDPANNKRERTIGRFDLTFIVTMNYKTSRATAGTGELMKLDAINKRIVKTLR